MGELDRIKKNLAAEVDALQKKETLYQSDLENKKRYAGSEELQKLNEEGVKHEQTTADAIQKITATEAGEEVKIQRQKVDDIYKNWIGSYTNWDLQVQALSRKTWSEMTTAFSSSYYDILTGKWDDLGNVWKNFCDNMLKAFADMLAQMTVKWLAEEVIFGKGFSLTGSVTGSTGTGLLGLLTKGGSALWDYLAGGSFGTINAGGGSGEDIGQLLGGVSVLSNASDQGSSSSGGSGGGSILGAIPILSAAYKAYNYLSGLGSAAPAIGEQGLSLTEQLTQGLGLTESTISGGGGGLISGAEAATPATEAATRVATEAATTAATEAAVSAGESSMSGLGASALSAYSGPIGMVLMAITNTLGIIDSMNEQDESRKPQNVLGLDLLNLMKLNQWQAQNPGQQSGPAGTISGLSDTINQMVEAGSHLSDIGGVNKSKEEILALVNQALGPANAELIKMSEAFGSVKVAMTDLPLDETTYYAEDYKNKIADLRTELAATADPIKTLTDSILQSGVAAMGADDSIKFLSDSLQLTKGETAILTDDFKKANDITQNAGDIAKNTTDAIDILATMLGIGADSAKALAEALGLIPRDVSTTYSFNTVGGGTYTPPNHARFPGASQNGIILWVSLYIPIQLVQ